jgi:predicted ATPase
MKLKSIQFKDHPALGDYILKLNTRPGPQVHYLVGNNGSGKSQILSAIYSVLSGKNFDTEHKYSLVLDVEASRPELDYINLPGNQKLFPGGGKIEDITFESLGNHSYHRNILAKADATPTGSRMNIGDSALCPIVYSEVEINFTKQKVSSTTGQIADIDKPSEKSDDLNTVVPQLLVDIQTDDDSKVARVTRFNKDRNKLDNELSALNLKMPRFEGAYNLVMKGSKQFNGIDRDGSGYTINFKDSKGVVVDLSDLSSGEKQVIYRLGFILKNLDTIKNGIVLIDEPEISLHPDWQIKFKEILLKLFKGTEIQIIIATHSPYIFHHFDSTKEECIHVNRNNKVSKNIELDIRGNIENPSPNFISYKAFGLVSENLHLELYAKLAIISGTTSVNSFNNWLAAQNPGLVKENRSATGASHFPGGHTVDETLPIWIRNKLSHPDITDRRDFTKADLKKSINLMVKVLTR